MIAFGTSRLERSKRRLFRETRWSPRVERILRATGAQLIHAHFAFDGIQILPTAKRLRLPLIVTLHGHDITASASVAGKAGDLYREQLKDMFEASTKIIAVSQFIADQAKRYGAPPEKLELNYIGVPPIPIKRTLDSHWDIIFVGRLVEKKGIADLIEAVAKVGRWRDGLRVGIVGDGPLKSQLEKQSRAVDANITFLGSLSPNEVRTQLASSRIFAAPSKTAPDGDSEGFGMVFLEAALASLPIISYRHGGVSEAVCDGQTGLLAPEGDIDALAANLMDLLEDSKKARTLGAAGLTRAMEQFDISKQARKLESVYERAVAR